MYQKAIKQIMQKNIKKHVNGLMKFRYQEKMREISIGIDGLLMVDEKEMKLVVKILCKKKVY